MKIPLLLDNLICFAIAIAFATLFSFLGAWMAHATRDQRPILPDIPRWQPIRNGALVAAALLYVSGVGALWWAGDYNINSGLFGALFWNKRRIDQGLIGLAWTAILVFWWVVAVCCIALVVAFMTVRLHRHDPKGVRAGQFSLRTFFIASLIVSVALMLWINARQWSIIVKYMLIHSILFSYGI